jgi:predicted RNA-binding protein with PUA-like domain
MPHWLMKTEPEDYSWDRLVADGETDWTGVRNHQAARNLRSMQVGDRAFFYRSMVEPAIVGVMTISSSWFPNPAEPEWAVVKVKPLEPAPSEVSLKAIKADPRLAQISLIRQSRLSVMPIEPEHWAILCAMAGLEP